MTMPQVSDEQIAVDAEASGFSGKCAKKRREYFCITEHFSCI